MTAYGGTYVALAAELDAHLITGDRRLVRAIEDRNLKVVPVLPEDDERRLARLLATDECLQLLPADVIRPLLRR